MAGTSFPKFSSVKTLLNGLFDYAGLFPPASLSLEDAMSEYLDHRQHPDAWMLGPFVIPIGMLEAIVQMKTQLSSESPVPLIVLPRVAKSWTEFADSLNTDFVACSDFLDQAEGTATIEGFEFRIPEDALISAGETTRNLSRISQLFEASSFASYPAFAEIQRTSSFREILPVYFLGLAAAGPRLYGKIRCGGMKDSDFPSTSELASFIHTAVRVGHPFKATAGLHHPLRHYNEGQQVMMHGFMNVFFAVTLSRVHNLEPEQIQPILDEESPNKFVFTDAGIEWGKLKASTTDFIRDRRSMALSIGSCSFSEPREDLMDLGWLSSSGPTT